MKGWTVDELRRRWRCSEKLIGALLYGEDSLVDQGYLEERDGLYYVTDKGLDAAFRVGELIDP